MKDDRAKQPRGPATSVEDLEVFQLAHELVLAIYKLTESFPRQEMFGLVSQLRRAAASVPANLAEGAGRLNTGEYRQFVGIARGSAAEASYHLMLARDLGYIPSADYDRLRGGYDRVCQMLTRLSQALGSA
jgi:four helix bundle protein